MIRKQTTYARMTKTTMQNPLETGALYVANLDRLENVVSVYFFGVWAYVDCTWCSFYVCDMC